VPEPVQRRADLGLIAAEAALLVIDVGKNIFPDAATVGDARKAGFLIPAVQLVQPVEMAAEVGSNADAEYHQCRYGTLPCPENQAYEDQGQTQPKGVPANILHAKTLTV